MNAWTSDWIPLFVLPNLLVKEPVEVEFVALFRRMIRDV